MLPNLVSSISAFESTFELALIYITSRHPPQLLVIGAHYVQLFALVFGSG